jgi:hypothetical protein
MAGIETSIHTLVDPFTYSAWQMEQREMEHNDKFQRMMAAHGGSGFMTETEALTRMGIGDQIALEMLKEKQESKACGKCHQRLNSQGICPKCSN